MKKIIEIFLIFAIFIVLGDISYEFSSKMGLGYSLYIIYVLIFTFIINKKSQTIKKVERKFDIKKELRVIVAFSIIQIVFIFSMEALASMNTSITPFNHSVNLIKEVIFFSYIILFGPLWEEVFYRKFIYGIVKYKYGLKIYIVLSTILFSLGHRSLYQSISVLPAGIFYAYIYHRTQDIKYSLLIHIFLNFFYINNKAFIRANFTEMILIHLFITIITIKIVNKKNTKHELRVE